MKEAISMKKWTRLVAFLTIGATLAACSNDTEESAMEPESEQTTNTETNVNNDYQTMLDQAKVQYDAEKLDEAAGTLSLLLKEDLTEYPDIQSEAESLLEEVNLTQAEQAREVASASSDKTEYQTERQSSVLGEEYLAATGKSIEDATDEELGNWLAEKEEKAEAETNSEETATEETETQDQKTFATDKEAEDYAFTQSVDRLELNNENYSIFVDRTDNQWVSIEVRETVKQDGVEWSNLIGLYRYDLQTDSIEKLDSVTGEYQDVE